MDVVRSSHSSSSVLATPAAAASLTGSQHLSRAGSVVSQGLADLAAAEMVAPLSSGSVADGESVVREAVEDKSPPVRTLFSRPCSALSNALLKTNAMGEGSASTTLMMGEEALQTVEEQGVVVPDHIQQCGQRVLVWFHTWLSIGCFYVRLSHVSSGKAGMSCCTCPGRGRGKHLGWCSPVNFLLQRFATSFCKCR
jgi:hypothetical protein